MTKSNSADNMNYYSAMLKAMGDWFGYSEKDMHDLLTYKFLFRMKEVKNESVGYILKVDELTQGQFEEYIKDIKLWAGQFGFMLDEHI